MLPDCSEFQSENVQMYGYVFHGMNGRNRGSISRIGMGKTVRGCFKMELGWEKVPNWECVDDIKIVWEETENGHHVEEIDEEF